MIRPINRDVLLLARPSVPATRADIPTADDLLDTLRANADRCVGMAANMIGVLKRIIAVNDGGEIMVMFNPEILKKEGEYEAEEGCLSLVGKRKAVRYTTVKVKYRDERFKTQVKSFSGFTAQIIQHEMDHLEGILI